MSRPTVVSLCSGIGGIDLGFEWAGFEIVAHSEIEPYACAVLARQWPDVPNLGDLTTIDWSTVERPDVITAGYPCQPFSLAGKRQGEADPRHLWPHVARAVRELRPRYVVLENVPGHRSLGFDAVLADLAACGYDAEWDCVPAAALGAPHRRDRVWIVAYPQPRGRDGGPGGFPSSQRWAEPAHRGEPLADADSGRQPQPGWSLPQIGGWPGDRGEQERRSGWAADVDPVGPLEPGLGGAADGVPAGMDVEPWERGVPRVLQPGRRHPHRTARLKALGNAVVPQVAEHVARLVLSAHERERIFG